MKIKTFAENSSEINFALSLEQIEDVSARMLEFAVKNLNVEKYSVDFAYFFEILICNNDAIQEINAGYRNKDYATDVITFALYNDSDEAICKAMRAEEYISLGQIIISDEKVTEQAKENEISPKEEFLNLLAHGVLHLLGYLHEDEESLNNMLDLQAKMIEDLENV